MGNQLIHAGREASTKPAAPEQGRVEPPAPLHPVPLIVGAASDRAELDADRRAGAALARLANYPAPVRRATVAGVGVGAAGGALPAPLAGDIEGLRGAGSPLPPAVRGRMETAFGASFAGVRVHTDEYAARLNRSVSAAAFTTGSDIFLGRGHYQPDTAEGEYVLAHELAHTLQPDQTLVRRRFLSTPGEVLPWQEVAEQVKGDPVAEQLIKIAGIDGTVSLQDVVKRLAGGPDIVFTKPADLIGEATRLTTGNKDYFHPTAGATGRRRVRILALMEQRIAQLGASKNVFVQKQSADVADMTKQLEQPVLAQKDMLRMIKEAADEWSKDNRHVWLSYQLLSQFGPLSHQLVIELGKNPDEDKLNQDIVKELRSLRMVMLAKPNVGVVAHRGAGPTNRTMGGLIDQADTRRTERPAENSPEAFDTALVEASTTAENAALDGVECDVFLSADGEAIVTHEANLQEQLATALQPGLEDRPHVYEREAAEILGVQRTAKPESGFISLAELLLKVVPVAHKFYEVTGRPFRMEIEMKGSAPAFGGVDKYEEKIPGDTKKRLGNKGNYLRIVVAKQISQMKKAMVDVPMEFVLFNGVEADAHDFAATRRRKVALGDITVGLGHGPGDKKKPITTGVFGDDVDEIRFGLAAAVSDLKWMTPMNKKYIMTGVFGQEFAPAELVKLRRVEPSLDLPTKEGRKPETEIQQALANRGTPTKDETSLQKLIDAIKTKQIDVTYFRLLTDYPAKAAYLKRVIGDAIPH